jgi:hypothetical protein
MRTVALLAALALAIIPVNIGNASLECNGPVWAENVWGPNVWGDNVWAENSCGGGGGSGSNRSKGITMPGISPFL